MKNWASELTLIVTLAVYVFLSGEFTLIAMLWSFSALIFAILWSAQRTVRKKPRTAVFWGFVAGSNLFMAFAMLSWFFNLGSTKTGGSTSSLIFAVMPFWSFIIGGVGSAIGAGFQTLNKASQH